MTFLNVTDQFTNKRFNPRCYLRAVEFLPSAGRFKSWRKTKGAQTEGMDSKMRIDEHCIIIPSHSCSPARAAGWPRAPGSSSLHQCPSETFQSTNLSLSLSSLSLSHNQHTHTTTHTAHTHTHTHTHTSLSHTTPTHPPTLSLSL